MAILGNSVEGAVSGHCRPPLRSWAWNSEIQGYRTGAETRLNCRPGWSELCLTLPLTQTTLVERVPNEIRTRVEKVGAWNAIPVLGTTFNGIAAWQRSVHQYV